jgi:ABC-type glycerol-3-phosphate transport system substrate-binding protein
MNKTTIATAVALMMLAACGQAAPDTPTEAVAEVPVTEVNLTASGPPDACLDALDLADDSLADAGTIMGISGESLDAAAAAIGAAVVFDVAGLQTATADIEAIHLRLDELSPQVLAGLDEYRAARDECRTLG